MILWHWKGPQRRPRQSATAAMSRARMHPLSHTCMRSQHPRCSCTQKQHATCRARLSRSAHCLRVPLKFCPRFKLNGAGWRGRTGQGAGPEVRHWGRAATVLPVQLARCRRAAAVAGRPGALVRRNLLAAARAMAPRDPPPLQSPSTAWRRTPLRRSACAGLCVMPAGLRHS